MANKLPANIQIDWLNQPAEGCVIIRHCPACNIHEIQWSPYAAKPKGANVWVLHLECMECWTLPKTFVISCDFIERHKFEFGGWRYF